MNKSLNINQVFDLLNDIQNKFMTKDERNKLALLRDMVKNFNKDREQYSDYLERMFVKYFVELDKDTFRLRESV